MTTTTFIPGTPIVSAWLNDVNGATYSSSGVYNQGATGATNTTVATKLRESVSVKDFGAVGDGVADDTTAIQAAVTYAKSVNKRVFIPSGTYLVSNTAISNITGNAIASTPVLNGISVFGETGSILKASGSFPANTPIIKLNGNSAGNTTVAQGAVVQNFNCIENLVIDGSAVAGRGLQLQAVAYSSFANLYFKNFAGGIADAVIYINGTTVSGQDDVDTTYGCSFEDVTIMGATGWGVLGTANRCGSMVFKNCDIRNCTYDGMRMSFAGLRLDNCTFTSNGSAGAATTGGFSATKSATGAVNRSLVMTLCQFENNYNHEINLDWIYGFTLDGLLLTPYVRAASAQAVGKFGNGTVGSSECEGGVVSGCRIAAYSGSGVEGMVAGQSSRNIKFDALSWDPSAKNWDTTAERFTINAASALVLVDGSDVATYSNRVEAKLYGLTGNGTAVVANVTGDGTEYLLSTHAVANSVFVVPNTGPLRAAQAITTAYISGTNLTVASITGTPLRVGQRITGTGVAPNTYITDDAGRTGGTGAYTVNISQTVASSGSPIAMTAWDSQHFDKYTGLFTAPYSGFYEFEMYWGCTGFGGAETDIEVAIVVDPTGTPARYIVFKQTPPAALAAGAVNIYGGSRNIYLAAGAVVTGSLKISGGTKVVDIVRDTTKIAAPGGLIFSVVGF